MVFAVQLTLLAGALAHQAPLPDDSRPVRIQPQHCGRYAIAVLADYTGAPAGEGRWEELLPEDHAPFSLAELAAAADTRRLSTLLVQWDDPTRADLGCPCILFIKSSAEAPNLDHFVACFGTRGEEVLLAEYPGTPTWVPKHQLLRQWTGVALYIGKPGDQKLAHIGSQARCTRWALAYQFFGVVSALALSAFAIKAVRRSAAS